MSLSKIRMRIGVALVLCAAVFCGCRTHPKPPAPAPVPPPPAPAPIVQTNAAIVPPRDSNMPPADSADNIASNLLAWDAVSKSYEAQAGEETAKFVFSVTNISPEMIMIYDTSSTCDCTVAKLPQAPWPLMPKRSGQISATIDLRKKAVGANTNYVIVFTSKGNKMLTLKAFVPPRPAATNTVTPIEAK